MLVLSTIGLVGAIGYAVYKADVAGLEEYHKLITVFDQDLAWQNTERGTI